MPSELRRRRLLAEAEAALDVRWRDDCPADVGRKVAALVTQLSELPGRVYDRADAHLEIGSSEGYTEYDSQAILSGGTNGDGEEANRLEALAAVVYAYAWLSENDHTLMMTDYDYERGIVYHPEDFIETVNYILLGARVEWTFEDGLFTQRGNSVLHADVVKPASVLLDSDARFQRASAAFQTAINRLSENHPGAAITDAGTAVQEFFRALGVNGNSLSDQLNAAQKASIITGYDRAVLQPFSDWLNADRSTRGNAHHHNEGDVTKADAWLAIHVACALMVRLSNEEPRYILAARERREAAAHEAALTKAESEAEDPDPDGDTLVI
ncbi:hypothetical protein [Microbacterium testaceum]|uniref:hypothetical protein n=1 Tax=Microbacterium testaceum TaxID=2033 RepID=UPI002435F039|nr:hypothetical protein [Microbacterium testaceum]